MVKKFKLQTIITALLCSVILLGCSNLIEDLKDKENPAPVVPVPAAEDPYLTFKGNGEFILGINTSEGGSKAWNGTVEYSTDKINWSEWNKSDDSTITAVASDGSYYIYLRGKDNTYFSDDSDGTILALTGAATSVECNGNIMTLLDWENTKTAVMGDYCFQELFEYCDKLTKAPSLPATVLSQSCYGSMFASCTSLVTAPELPATTLAVECYVCMFGECTALENPPELPAKTAVESCYAYMFRGCSALVTAPELPATTLGDDCYFGMFYYCEALKTAPELPAKNLAYECYSNMFGCCSALETAPELPATTLTEWCYYAMFNGCSSLKASPALPATTLEVYCYEAMFGDCTSLTSVGKIGNGNVIDISVDSAMQYMFSGCSELKFIETTATDADRFISLGTVTGSNSVNEMFYGTKDGSVVTPTAGKSYKVSSGIDSPTTYNIDWRTTKIASLDKTPYELATGASKIVFGKTSDYSAITADTATYTKYAIGETDNDAVYAYYKSATPVELYVLADGEIKFEDDDIEHSLKIPYAGPFNSCSEAECIVLKNIDTSELTKSTRFFVFDSKLKTLDISGLDTKNSTSMEMMFYGCLSLETLDLSVLDTSSVTSMKQMFANCNEIKELDLSGFSFDNVVDTSMMFDFFSTTNKLQTIYVKEGTDLSTMASITSSEDMFKNCTSLYGANGTSLDEEHNDKSYARIDGGSSNPGYFTKKGDAPYVPSIACSNCGTTYTTQALADACDKEYGCPAFEVSENIENVYFRWMGVMDLKFNTSTGDIVKAWGNPNGCYGYDKCYIPPATYTSTLNEMLGSESSKTFSDMQTEYTTLKNITEDSETTCYEISYVDMTTWVKSLNYKYTKNIKTVFPNKAAPELPASIAGDDVFYLYGVQVYIFDLTKNKVYSVIDEDITSTVNQIPEDANPGDLMIKANMEFPDITKSVQVTNAGEYQIFSVGTSYSLGIIPDVPASDEDPYVAPVYKTPDNKYFQVIDPS